MDYDFDVFVKEHLDNILCEVEKNQALAQIKARPAKPRKLFHMFHIKLHHKVDAPVFVLPEMELQDCAVSPSFSFNHL
jgi:hypothetical protein